MRKTKIVLLFLLVFSITVCALGQEETSEESPGYWLEKGDEYFQSWQDERAIKAYQEVIKKNPSNPQEFAALWKIARSWVNVGEEIGDGSQKELAKYEKALEYANRAIEINQGNPWGYIEKGASRGSITLFKGIWESIGLVKKVKKDIDRALELAPENCTAWFLMGRTHLKLSEKSHIFRIVLGLGWASYEEAVKSFKKAISLFPPQDPIQVRTHLRLAQALIKLEEYTKAVKHLTKAIELPIRDHQDEGFKKESKLLLEKIKK